MFYFSLLCQQQRCFGRFAFFTAPVTAVTMSNYPVPPPAYGPTATQQNSKYQSVDDSHEPLLASSSRGGAGGVYDQPDQHDLPDDFKVRSVLAS